MGRANYKPDDSQGTINASDGGSLIITGGYFTKDPSAYVATSYKVDDYDDDIYKYVVVKNE